MNANKPTDMSDRIKQGIYKSPTYIERHKQAELRAQELDKLKHPSYKGENNSQFGTFWITNGIENKKWSEKHGPIPDGFKRGRITK